MKKALVEYNGLVKEVVNPGEEYPIYSGEGATMQWVDAPDDVTIFWTLEHSPEQGKAVWVERDLPYADPVLRRKIAYGEAEVQLGMLYDDIISGNIDSGKWVSHIQNVKKTVPKPPASAYENVQDPAEELDAKMAADANREPGVDKQIKFSSMDAPAWSTAEGWSGPNYPLGFEADKE